MEIFMVIQWDLPSGKHTNKNNGKIHHSSWENNHYFYGDFYTIVIFLKWPEGTMI